MSQIYTVFGPVAEILRVGLPVAYVPDHAQGDVTHKDVEFGFVSTLVDKGQVFVRYWQRGKEGEVLRTTSCAEMTDTRNLVHAIHHKVTAEMIEEQFRLLGYFEEDEDAK